MTKAKITQIIIDSDNCLIGLDSEGNVHDWYKNFQPNNEKEGWVLRKDNYDNQPRRITNNL